MVGGAAVGQKLSATIESEYFKGCFA
jgi:hypothetical protein